MKTNKVSFTIDYFDTSIYNNNYKIPFVINFIEKLKENNIFDYKEIEVNRYFETPTWLKSIMNVEPVLPYNIGYKFRDEYDKINLIVSEYNLIFNIYDSKFDELGWDKYFEMLENILNIFIEIKTDDINILEWNLSYILEGKDQTEFNNFIDLNKINTMIGMFENSEKVKKTLRFNFNYNFILKEETIKEELLNCNLLTAKKIGKLEDVIGLEVNYISRLREIFKSHIINKIKPAIINIENPNLNIDFEEINNAYKNIILKYLERGGYNE